MTNHPFFLHDQRGKRALLAIALLFVITVVICTAGCTDEHKTGQNKNLSENQAGQSTKNIQITHIPAPVPFGTMPLRSGNQVYIDDFQSFLTEWNEKMHWGFSTQQIENFNRSLMSGILKKYQITPRHLTLDIPDIKSFSLEIGDAIGLTRQQSENFATTADDDLRRSKIIANPPLSVPTTTPV